MYETVVLNTTTAVTWILFVVLFGLVFVWWRSAYLIFVKKDYSNVCLKKGESPAKPKKWAILTGIGSFLAGTVALWVGTKVILFAVFYYKDLNFIHHSFSGWSEIIAVVFWAKIFYDFLLKQQAHSNRLGRKKKNKAIAA